MMNFNKEQNTRVSTNPSPLTVFIMLVGNVMQQLCCLPLSLIHCNCLDNATTGWLLTCSYFFIFSGVWREHQTMTVKLYLVKLTIIIKASLFIHIEFHCCVLLEWKYIIIIVWWVQQFCWQVPFLEGIYTTCRLKRDKFLAYFSGFTKHGWLMHFLTKNILYEMCWHTFELIIVGKLLN